MQALNAVKPSVTVLAYVQDLLSRINLQTIARSLWQPVAQRASRVFQNLQTQFTGSWQDLSESISSWYHQPKPALQAMQASPWGKAALVILVAIVDAALGGASVKPSSRPGW